MVEKRRQVARLYNAEGVETGVTDGEQSKPAQPYPHLGHLQTFSGSHPGTIATTVAAQDWRFESGIESQRPRWARYLGMLRACPRDAVRILISRLLLTWNTYVTSPKLR